VKVVGERRAPLDLTVLSDAELAFLRRTMLKIAASRDGINMNVPSGGTVADQSAKGVPTAPGSASAAVVRRQHEISG
jgi:hypothetical protein